MLRNEDTIGDSTGEWLPYVINIQKMFKGIEPGSDRIYDTRKWHQGALHFAINKFLEGNEEYEYEYEKGTIKQKSSNIIYLYLITSKKYTEVEGYTKLTLKRKYPDNN